MATALHPCPSCVAALHDLVESSFAGQEAWRARRLLRAAAAPVLARLSRELAWAVHVPNHMWGQYYELLDSCANYNELCGEEDMLAVFFATQGRLGRMVTHWAAALADACGTLRECQAAAWLRRVVFTAFATTGNAHRVHAQGLPSATANPASPPRLLAHIGKLAEPAVALYSAATNAHPRHVCADCSCRRGAQPCS